MKRTSKFFQTFFVLIICVVASLIASAQSSVLSSGNWYKISVTEDGIYKLSYSDLQALGINVSSINPHHLSLYGNGGGMLPEPNYMPRISDLVENAIEVVGEGDGSFDTGDYVLFYGQSQHRWQYNSMSNRFHHVKNIYSDTTYYFLTVGTVNGKRIQNEPSLVQPANQSVSEFDDYAFHELDSVNLLHSGKEWYGEQLDMSNPGWSLDFVFPNASSALPSYARINFAGRSIGFPNTVDYSVLSNSDAFNINQTSIGISYNYANIGIDTMAFSATSDTVKVTLAFSSSDITAMGWINFIELNVRRGLIMTSSQLIFRDRFSAGTGNIADFTVANTTANDFIWDVTAKDNVRLVGTTFNSGSTEMRLATDTLKEFIISDNVNFLSPNLIGSVANQNLHAIGPVNLLIITHPDFLAEALQFENMHASQDGLTVATVTTEQVYNEYSSGAQDVTAIRDFIRSVYLQSTSTDSLRYVMLVGDGSYDFKNRIADNTNLVPGYQRAQSLNATTSFVTDDFFVLMDSLEGDLGNISGTMLADVGIGRLPVKTASEAQTVFNKTYAYRNSSLGDWRKILTFVADDEDNNTHVNQSEVLNRIIDSVYCEYNIEKIYLDSYVQTANTYPDVNAALQNRGDSGALFINYIGHGNEYSWAAEVVLDTTMIDNFANAPRLPFYYSATSAYFNRFDDPALVTGGERLLLNSTGGAIASLSISRIAYSGSGYSMMQRFFNHLLRAENGVMPRLGDIMRKTRQEYTDLYTYNYILLGDPALRLAYPENKVVTTAINGNPVSANTDTLLAGSTVVIDGEIHDTNNQLMTSFTGQLNVIVFNHPVQDSTLGNDVGNSWPVPLKTWTDTIYAGTVNVTSGTFSFSFVMPTTVDSAFTFGKISYYAQDGIIDASGCYDNFVIGGGLQSVKENAKKELAVTVFPNPASGECNFKINGNKSPSFSFSLYDVADRLVIEMKEVPSSFTVALDKVNSGLYIYDIASSDKEFFKRGKLIVK
jgi:hypothetical protein